MRCTFETEMEKFLKIKDLCGFCSLNCYNSAKKEKERGLVAEEESHQI